MHDNSSRVLWRGKDSPTQQSTPRRRLLYLQPHQSPDIFFDRDFIDAWEIHRAFSSASALKLLELYDFQVGIVLLDETFLSEQLDEMEQAFVTHNLQWLGLKPAAAPDCSDNAFLRRFIALYLHDYHTLPMDKQRLLQSLQHQHHLACLKLEIANQEPAGIAEQLIGRSAAIRKVRQTLGLFAATELPVLITGESGTGKELAAQAIHACSTRATGPLVIVNCGALSDSLMQSELFGHEKGAFTGAYRRRTGRFESASGGTIFLDEIGELPLHLQKNLLRFLQHGTLERVGGSTTLAVKTRIIAATNVDLEDAVRQGTFRKDLYYRLNVLRLNLPALRERPEDIEPLARHFLAQSLEQRYFTPKKFSPQAISALTAYHWPGNIRELMNKIRRAVILSDNRQIHPVDLDLSQYSGKSHLLTLKQYRATAEKQMIQFCLKSHRNNLSAAARQLDVSRVTLYKLLRKHNIPYAKVVKLSNGQKS